MAIDTKHVVNLSGKDFVLYAGLLNEAHERGLKSIEVELIQAPSQENEQTAIMRATVILKDGESFSDYGDASPKNTASRVATALLRMASTRAKGRALRDAINVGTTMLEELSEQEVAASATPANGKARAREAVKAAETTTVAEQVHTPAPAPGFEAWYETGGKRFQRLSLVSTCRADQAQAADLGLEVSLFEPEEARNEELWAYGKQLRARIKAAKEQQVKEEAA